MTMNVQTFVNTFKYGLAKPSRYNVIIASPNQGIAPEIGMAAEEAEIPGKSFATREMGLYGPSILFPYREIFTNLRITFMCSGDFWERKWMEEWQRRIVNPKSGFFGYHKYYTRDLRIQQLDDEGFIGYEGIALAAWPVTIENQPLAYRATNDYHRLTVTFAYTRFMDYDVHGNENSPGVDGGSDVSANLTPIRKPGVRDGGGGLPTPGGPVAQ